MNPKSFREPGPLVFCWERWAPRWAESLSTVSYACPLPLRGGAPEDVWKDVKVLRHQTNDHHPVAHGAAARGGIAIQFDSR